MKEPKDIWTASSIVCVLALLAAACAPATPAPVSPASPAVATPGTTASPAASATGVAVATPGAAATPVAAQIQKGGRVIEGVFAAVQTLNPILQTDTASATVTRLIYDSLIQVDPKNGEPKPRMATFSQSRDGLTYTFTINDKANWSDGKPVLAEDYLVAKKLVAKSRVTLRKSYFQDITGWQDYVDKTAASISGIVIDSANPKRFSVTLSKVSCDAIFQISQFVVPAHIFGKYATDASKNEIDSAPENTSPPVASGPFKFKEWRRGEGVVTLTRHDTYWQGAPHVDEYIYKLVDSTTALAAQLKTGEVNLGRIEPKDLADIEAQGHLRVSKYQELGYTFIGWRTDSRSAPALGDKKVRQALAYGLDIDSFVRTVLFGQGVKQLAHHVPVQWAHPDPRSLNSYAYDARKAELLLQEAGYKKSATGIYEKDGRPIGLTISVGAGESRARDTFARFARDRYRTIGIDAEIKYEDDVIGLFVSGEPSLEAVVTGWSFGGFVDPYLAWHSSQIPDHAAKKPGFGFTGFKNADLDRAIEQGRSPTNGDCSIATRKRHYETFNKILNDEQPYNFGFSSMELTVTNKNMQNFDPGSFGTSHNIHEWWFRK